MNPTIATESMNSIGLFLATRSPELTNPIFSFPYFTMWSNHDSVKAKYGSSPTKNQYTAECKAIRAYSYSLAMSNLLQTQLSKSENPQAFFDFAVDAPIVPDEFDFISFNHWVKNTDIFKKYSIDQYPKVEKPSDENFLLVLHKMEDSEIEFSSILKSLGLNTESAYKPLSLDDIKLKKDELSYLIEFELDIYNKLGEKGFLYLANEEKYSFESSLIKYITSCLYEAERHSDWACHYAQSMIALQDEFLKPF